MKTKALATLLLAVVVVFSAWLSSCGRTRTETVSAATLSQLPASKTLEIDLTKPGTVYTFEEPRTNFSRVTLRTAAGVKPFADLLQASHTSLRGGLVLGTPRDMRNHLPTAPGGTTTFDCGVFCQCNGGSACLDLIVSGKCGSAFWCSQDTNSCFCVVEP